MDQLAETGILSDEGIIGKYLNFSAKIGSITDKSILLRDVKESKGRFYRDHMWVEKIPNALLATDKKGYIRFRGKLVHYTSRSVSFKSDNRWTSIAGKDSIDKYKIVNIEIRKSGTLLTPDRMKKIFAMLKMLYSQAILAYENDLWVIKIDGTAVFASDDSVKNKELDVLYRIFGDSHPYEKLKAEIVIPQSSSIQSSDHCTAKVITRFCYLNPSFQAFISPEGKFIIVRSGVCGDAACSGISCQNKKCGAKFVS